MLLLLLAKVLPGRVVQVSGATSKMGLSVVEVSDIKLMDDVAARYTKEWAFFRIILSIIFLEL